MENIRDAIARELDPKEYDEIRNLWKAHSIAEDARDIPGLLATLTEDSEYRIVGTDHLWAGHAGAEAFYKTLIGAIPDVHFDLAQIVIGPQGVFEEAQVSGTFKSDLLGFSASGKKIQGSVAIFFPWCPKAKKFKGERIYLELPTLLAGN